MNDIQSRADIELLVNAFYERVRSDNRINFFFIEVKKLDWGKHLPIMYSFWEAILLGSGNYKGNPMFKHIALNRKHSLTSEHFEVWLTLWKETIQRHFEGKKAEKAGKRAENIAQLMQFKIEQDNNKQQ